MCARGKKLSLPSRVDGCLNEVDCSGERHVLPKSNDMPSRPLEGIRRLTIAKLGCPKLRRPIVSVTPRDRSVLGAHMPEAAVEEDGYASFRKHDIGQDRTSVIDMQSKVHSEPQSSCVERRAKASFGSSVSARVRFHDLRRVRRRWEWVRATEFPVQWRSPPSLAPVNESRCGLDCHLPIARLGEAGRRGAWR